MKRRFKTFLERIWKIIRRPDMLLLPGQLAFFLVLAIIPTMTLISYGASMLNLSTDFLYDFLAKAFSYEIADIILSTATYNASIKMIILLLVCYYLASNGTASVIAASNQIYGIENSGFIKRRLKAFMMAIIFILIIVFLLIIPIFGQQIVGLIQTVNLNEDVTAWIVKVFNYLQSPIMWIFLFLLIKLIYVIAPDKHIQSSTANYGAVFTTIAWILTTWIYSMYINNIADYTAFYGSLASISILMIWFYLLAYFFVIGMSLNYQKESESILEKTSSLKTK